MFGKNYIINRFEETLSPKFIRQQKYLDKVEHKLYKKKTSKKKKFGRSLGLEWRAGYFKRSQGLKGS